MSQSGLFALDDLHVDSQGGGEPRASGVAEGGGTEVQAHNVRVTPAAPASLAVAAPAAGVARSARARGVHRPAR